MNPEKVRFQGAFGPLERAGVAVDALADKMEQAVEHCEPRESAPPLTPAAKRALQAAHRQAQASGSTGIGAEHVLLGLGANPESGAAQALARALPDTRRLQGRPGGGRETERGASSTPLLDQHSRDLTAAAREGQLDPVVGRESETEQTIEVLSRRTKNNPVLLGDPGVGKTAIVEGIAQRIVNGDVPQTPAGKRVVSLDLSGMVAGAGPRRAARGGRDHPGRVPAPYREGRGAGTPLPADPGA